MNNEQHRAEFGLPPLPAHPELISPNEFQPTRYSQIPRLYEWAKSYARAAIELDRQQRGEPIALGGQPFREQPAPAQEVSDADALKAINYYADLRVMASRGQATKQEVHDEWERIKALLARYGAAQSGKTKVFAINVFGNPMREYASGKWENAAWPSDIPAQPAASAERQPQAYQVRNPYGGKWHDADEATFNVVCETRPEDARKLYTAPVAAQPSVPIPPTPEMVKAFQQGFLAELHKHEKRRTMTAEEAGLRAMLEAAPTPSADGQAQQDETYTDGQGTVWRRPTAWAYAMACEALHKANDRTEAAQQDADKVGIKCPTKDLLGTACSCGKGTYREQSVMDDISGTLHCTACGKQVNRHQP